MQIGLVLDYAGAFAEQIDMVVEAEKQGLDLVAVAEGYSFDAVSQLGYLAALTSTVRIQTAIMPMYTRTPSLIAMTAAGLDHVSGGRFTLGLGASGPQVIEGFHGVPFDAPLARTREIVEICRQVWRREALVHHGERYDIPLGTERGGSGLGKPLKLINRPSRADIPVAMAALGPGSVALAAEIAEVWLPIFYWPERADVAFGESLARGASRRSPEMGPLQIQAQAMLAPGDEGQELVRKRLALYIGGMGAKGRNFYHSLARAYGFAGEADVVQEHYLAGEPDRAAAAVPDEMVHGVALTGAKQEIVRRLHEFDARGVDTLVLEPLAGSLDQRRSDVLDVVHWWRAPDIP